MYYKGEEEKVLFGLSRKQASQILVKIGEISVDPFANHSNCTKMQDLLHGYRLRVGAMRVIYEVDTNSKIITVWKVAPRGSVYRK